MAHILKDMNKDKERVVVEKLLAGSLVALPTETVYGLGARADDDQAIAEIYAIKKRPHHNPLILHCADMDMVWQYVEKTDISAKIGSHFWPGPLTMVLKKRQQHMPYLARALELDYIAVRIPCHPITQRMIAKVGKPLAMPSANLSCKLSPTQSLHVQKAFAAHDLWIVEGGNALIGLESSVIAFPEADTIEILRPGSITAHDLQSILPASIRVVEKTERMATSENRKILSPGQMAQHYAPHKPLRKDVQKPGKNEAYLGFGNCERATLNLSPQGSIVEAAQHLYHYLHTLDGEPSFEKIGVAPIPYHGLGIAINDRLERAAQKQP